MKYRYRLLLILSISCFISCFGVDRRGGIVKYGGGEAVTGFGRFRPGPLSPGWKGPKLRLKQLVFENDAIGGTIVTDALCGPKFIDNPLPSLARDLFGRLADKRTGQGKTLIVAGREAYRLDGSGTLDGIPLRMDVVVLKKNFCLFDLVYFAPPQTFERGVKDFEGYVYGLRFP